MNKIEELLNELNKNYSKEEGMFKTTYYVNDITIEVVYNTATIQDIHGFYTSKINEPLLLYLKSII